MARFYVEHNGEWNIFSTIVDDFLFDEFVCIDALKAHLLYERYKELTEDIDSLMTDRPRVNVMSYTEATERMRKTEPQTDCDTNLSEKPTDSTRSKMEQVEDGSQYDFGEFADRLWKIAYERGKREALEQTEPQTEGSRR